MPLRNGTAHTPDGDRLAWTLHGDGPSMLVMNGLVSSVDPHWTRWVRHYQARFSVLTWDYRGHGASAPPRDFSAVSMEQFADDGAAVLNAAAVKRPAVVCGLSMGVQTALEFYVRYPQDVRALVLLCGTAGHVLNGLHHSEKLRKTMTSVAHRLEAIPPRLFDLLASPLVRTPLGRELAYLSGGVVRGATSPEEVDAIFQHATKRDPRLVARIAASYMNHTTWHILPSIAVPTLIIGGDRDDLVPVATVRAMHAQIPRSELHIVRGHGHLAQVEKAAEVHAVVDAFLARRAGGP